MSYSNRPERAYVEEDIGYEEPKEPVIFFDYIAIIAVCISLLLFS